MTVRFPAELLFHHCMPVRNVMFSTMARPDRRFARRTFRPAYHWLAERIGFFPFFFAVGCDEDAVRMTGYEDNWRAWMASTVVRGKRREIYRRRGEFPNLALFSFESMDGIFMDYAYWDIALNACMAGRSLQPRNFGCSSPRGAGHAGSGLHGAARMPSSWLHLFSRLRRRPGSRSGTRQRSGDWRRWDFRNRWF